MVMFNSLSNLNWNANCTEDVLVLN